MIKKTEIIKTEYKGLSGQSKKIILFVTGQLIILSSHSILFNCQKPLEANATNFI